jgi:hypothetical protein
LTFLDYDSQNLLETQVAIRKVKIQRFSLMLFLLMLRGLLFRTGVGLPVTSVSLWVSRRLVQQKAAFLKIKIGE